MNKLFLYALLVFATTNAKQSFGQHYPSFDWKSESGSITFNSVQMRVQDILTKKIIFKGYKDAKIKIHHDRYLSPLKAEVSIEAAGYFEMLLGDVFKFEYSVTDSRRYVQYSCTSDQSYVMVSIEYDEDGELRYIMLVCHKNMHDKKDKGLLITLEGFAPTTEQQKLKIPFQNNK